METKEDGLGYRFVTALTKAIAEYTEREESKNRAVFIYKGSDLRFALERVLFSRLSNDDCFFKAFRASGQIDIARAVAVRKKSINDFLKRVLDFLRITQALKFLISRFRSLENKRALEKTAAEKKIVFYLASRQFYFYGKPIFERIREKALYFSLNENIRKCLRENSEAFLDSSLLGRRISRISSGKSLLEKYGLTEAYDLALECLEAARPKKVVVFEGSAMTDEVINRVCRRLGIACVCIQQGWSTLLENGCRNMSFSKMLVWGEGFAELLKPYNPHQRFVATGDHMVEFPPAGAQKMSQEKTSIAFFAQGINKVITKKIMDDFVSLIEWSAANITSVRIIVREHPCYEIGGMIGDKDTLDKIELMPPIKYALRDVLEQSDVSVAINSTTVLESVAFGALPIIVNITGEPGYWPDIAKEGAAISVKSIEEAKAAISGIAKGKIHISEYAAAMDRARAKYFKAGGSQAVENIVGEITGS